MEGGLGFRDLAKFNDALLAKLAWRLIRNPNTLLARLLKARYYRDTSILDAKNQKNQSYGWSSILAGLDLIKKGSYWELGDGASIRMGKDNFIITDAPRPIQIQEEEADSPIKNYISTNGHHRFWNKELFDLHVSPEDAARIQNLYIPSLQHSADKLVWNYHSSGEYSVKSGYWFITHTEDYRQCLPLIPHGSVEVKTWIWKLPILPKIKHFIWRVLSQAIETKRRLNTRDMNIDPICPRCGLYDETINHIFFDCPYVQELWLWSNLPRHKLPQPFQFDIDTILTDFLDLQHERDISLSQILMPFWLMWKTWKSRNKYVFENIFISPRTLWFQTTAEIEEWITVTNEQSVRTMPHGPILHSNRWTPPKLNQVKCNFDASYNADDQLVTGGWIFRDNTGNCLTWGASKLGSARSPLEAETKALLGAIQQVWIRGFTSIIFEGDCSVLIDNINGLSANVAIRNMCLDISSWARKFTFTEFCFTRRTCNESAHVLARFGCAQCMFYSDSVNMPSWLESTLYHSNIG